MKHKVRNFSKRMGAAAMPTQPHMSGQNPGALDRATVVTIVRRLGYVALQVFETIQGNLVSSGRHQYAEALNDSLKPLVDLLIHFELEDTEVDNEIP